MPCNQVILQNSDHEIKYLDLLNETDDALRDGGRIGGVLGHGDGVALAVKEPAQLPQIALPLQCDTLKTLLFVLLISHFDLDVVLDGCGLHEEGIEAVLLAHPVNPHRRSVTLYKLKK